MNRAKAVPGEWERSKIKPGETNHKRLIPEGPVEYDLVFVGLGVGRLA